MKLFITIILVCLGLFIGGGIALSFMSINVPQATVTKTIDANTITPAAGQE